MSRPSIIRLLEVGLAFFGTLTLLSLAYFGLTSPDMPYSKSNVYTVDRPTDPTRAGDIRAGDQILSFNSKPFFWCMYFIDSPIYNAPRGVPIPVKYARAETGIQGVTEIVLKDPSAGLMFN